MIFLLRINCFVLVVLIFQSNLKRTVSGVASGAGVSGASDSEWHRKCLSGNGCTSLVKIGFCVEKLKAKMDAKCPNYCEKCGSGYQNIGKKKNAIPKHIEKEWKLFDESMKVPFKKLPELLEKEMHQKLEFFEAQNLWSDFLFNVAANDMNNEQTNDQILNKMSSALKLKNNPVAISSSTVLNQTTDKLQIYLEEFTKENDIKSQNKQKRIYHQLTKDKMVNGFAKYLRGNNNISLDVATALLPGPSLLLANVGSIMLNEAVAIGQKNIKAKTKEGPQLKIIEGKADKLTKETMATELELEKKLNMIEHEMVKSNYMVSSDLNRFVSDITDQITLTNQTNQLRARYLKDSLKQINTLLANYREYTRNGMNKEIMKNMKDACTEKGVTITHIVEKMSKMIEGDIPTARDSTNGDIRKLKKIFSEYNRDLLRISLLAPVCIALQDLPAEVSCNRLYKITEYTSKMQDLISSQIANYFREDSIRLSIESSINDQILKLSDYPRMLIEGKVEHLTKELSITHPYLSFFVYAKRSSNPDETDILTDPNEKFIVKSNEGGNELTVIWHPIENEPTGELWEKCYEGDLSSKEKGIWYVNRPRCVRPGIAVKKTMTECVSDLCTLGWDDKIPSCTAKFGSRIECFRAPTFDEILDPTEYLNSVSRMKFDVKHRKYPYAAEDLFRSNKLFDRTKADLESASFGYCLQAVIGQHSYFREPDFYYATTMTGAAFPWAYYMQDSILLKSRTDIVSMHQSEIDEYEKQVKKLEEGIVFSVIYNKQRCLKLRMMKILLERVKKLYNEPMLEDTIKLGNFLDMNAVVGLLYKNTWSLSSSSSCSIEQNSIGLSYTKQIMVFKKCHTQHTTMLPSKKEFHEKCIDIFKLTNKLKKDLENQLKKFDSKVEQKKLDIKKKKDAADQKKKSDEEKKNKKKIVLISVGVVLGLLVLVVIVVIFAIYKRRKNKKTGKKGVRVIHRKDVLAKHSKDLLRKGSKKSKDQIKPSSSELLKKASLEKRGSKPSNDLLKRSSSAIVKKSWLDKQDSKSSTEKLKLSKKGSSEKRDSQLRKTSSPLLKKSSLEKRESKPSSEQLKKSAKLSKRDSTEKHGSAIGKGKLGKKASKQDSKKPKNILKKTPKKSTSKLMSGKQVSKNASKNLQQRRSTPSQKN